MTLHCYVVPQSVVAHVTRVVHHVFHATGIGHHAVVRPISTLIHAATASPAPPSTCSAPVAAMRALRAMSGMLAAAAVAGGVMLGAAGANLAGSGLGAAARPSASSMDDSGVGASILPVGSASSGGGQARAASTVVPLDGTTAATAADSVLSTPSLLTGAFVAAPFLASATPAPNPGTTRAAVPRIRNRTLADAAGTPEAAPDTTPSTSLAPSTRILTASSPASRPSSEAPLAPVVDVPEPHGLAWLGFCSVALVAVLSRRTRRPDPVGTAPN